MIEGSRVSVTLVNRSMVTTPVETKTLQPPTTVEAPEPQNCDANPLPIDCFDEVPEGMELLDGALVEKIGMTLKHAGLQNALGAEWRTYSRQSQQRGKAYTEALCETTRQKRRPAVAYITQELLEQFGEPSTFPQAFPLIAEIASPDDAAEMLFEKAREYLASGSQEVWILLPETRLAFIVLPEQVLAFTEHQTIETQTVLKGFSITLAELFE